MFRLKKKIKVLSGLILAGTMFLSIGTLPVFASNWLGMPKINEPIIFQPQVGLPGFMEATTFNQGTTGYVGLLVQGLYDYGLMIGGILAAVVMMAGGVLWLVSAGSSDKVGQAKNLILGSLTGLLLLFGAWIILNTINPSLIKMDILDITSVKRISYCCHNTKGPLLMLKLSDGSTTCPDDSSVCQDNTSCINLLKKQTATSTNDFQCTDLKKWKCCEYNYPGTLNSDPPKLCVPIYNSYCPHASKIKPIGWDNNTVLTYSGVNTGFCAERNIMKKRSCISPCAKKDTGDLCNEDDYAGQSNTGHCYNGECHYNLGKEGEPCGNRGNGNSTCYAKGAGLTDRGNCDKVGSQELYSDTGGRGCEDDLKCCNFSKN